jgi:hypothetical protein
MITYPLKPKKNMSKCENCSPSDGSYASSFKAAKVRGGPTLQELRNQFYISQHKEVIHPKGWPQYMGDVHELNETGFSTDEFDKMSDIFKLEPADPLGRMEFRQVKLVNSGQDGDLTFLVNSDIESRGLVTITIGPIPDNDKQSKCNIRVLPFSKYSELLQPPYHGDKYPRLLLPKDNIIKLDVTLEYTDLGEVRYRTRGTEVTVENMDDEQKMALKRILEYEGAEMVSSFLRLLPVRKNSHTTEPYDGAPSFNSNTNKLFYRFPWWDTEMKADMASIVCGVAGGISHTVGGLVGFAGLGTGLGVAFALGFGAYKLRAIYLKHNPANPVPEVQNNLNEPLLNLPADRMILNPPPLRRTQSQ